MTHTLYSPVTYNPITVTEEELRVYQEYKFAEVIMDEETIEECIEWFSNHNQSLYNELFSVA